MKTMNKILSLEEVLSRTARRNPADIDPLLKYLNFKSKHELREEQAASEIALALRKAGSNDFATLFRGGDPVTYEEVLRDVAGKMKLPHLEKDAPAPEIEARLLEKVFEDAWDSMSEEERRTLMGALNLNEKEIPLGAPGALLTGVLLKKFGGFAVYRTSLIVANMVARALLGSGLSFATNAALTRSIGALLGPIGLIASGAWLAVDLAGPAYRKTVPAVLYVAMLRQILANRVTIGVVGDGSTGKDALIRNVFRLDANVDPVAGSTAEAEAYAIGTNGVAEVINYPGFNDYRAAVNTHTDERLHHTDLFLLVVDCKRGISGSDVAIMRKIQELQQPILVCLNKSDLIRDEKEKQKLLAAAVDRLGISGKDMALTAFDPDIRISKLPKGRERVLEWIRATLEGIGKEAGAADLPV